MEQHTYLDTSIGVVPRLPLPTTITPPSPITTPSPPSSGRTVSQPIPIPGAKAQKSPLPKRFL